jgi:MSHA biogenesis protein MshI
VTFRWPFNKTKHKHWLGINLSSLSPSAVIYSAQGVEAAVCFEQEQGLEALEEWLKANASADMPTVLVLDDDDYELLLAEAPSVPDEELSSAIEFRIGDLLAQPVDETAIQAVRLPEDAYRGRMSMAHVIASPNEKIQHWVDWAESQRLRIETITVPELSLLNVLALNAITQGIALLELGPKQGCIRLYQDGALYLTRQVEVGIDALDIQEDLTDSTADEHTVPSEHAKAEEAESLDAVAINEIVLDEISEEDFSVSVVDGEEIELELDEQLAAGEPSSDNDALNFDENSYVGFAPKAKINEEQVQSLVLEVQRSLDYYESQLGMGQVTQIWLMSGDKDLSSLVDTMQPALTAKIEQPNMTARLMDLTDFTVNSSCEDLNKTLLALGGALAYVAS